MLYFKAHNEKGVLSTNQKGGNRVALSTFPFHNGIIAQREPLSSQILFPEYNGRD